MAKTPIQSAPKSPPPRSRPAAAAAPAAPRAAARAVPRAPEQTPAPPRSRDINFKSYFAKPRSQANNKATLQSSRRSYDSPVLNEFDMWKPKDGTSYIRILPAPAFWGPDEPNDQNEFGYSVVMHPWIGNPPSNYLCLAARGQPCAACEAFDDARRSGDEQAIKDWRPRTQVVVWLLDREGENPSKPLVYIMGTRARDDIILATEDPRSGQVVNIEDMDAGRDLRCQKSGQGILTRYQFNLDHTPSPISDDPRTQAAILTHVIDNPLPKVLRWYTPEHVEKVVYGLVPERDPVLQADPDEFAPPEAEEPEPEPEGEPDPEPEPEPEEPAAAEVEEETPWEEEPPPPPPPAAAKRAALPRAPAGNGNVAPRERLVEAAPARQGQRERPARR